LASQKLAILFVLNERALLVGPQSGKDGNSGFTIRLSSKEIEARLGDEPARTLLMELKPGGTFALGPRAVVIAEQSAKTLHFRIHPLGSWATLIPPEKRDQTLPIEEFKKVFGKTDDFLRRIADMPDANPEKRTDPFLLIATR
jgi:hypothetical protein